MPKHRRDRLNGGHRSDPVRCALGKARTGRFAFTILVGLLTNEPFGWWWVVPPVRALVIVSHAVRESHHITACVISSAARATSVHVSFADAL